MKFLHWIVAFVSPFLTSKDKDVIQPGTFTDTRRLCYATFDIMPVRSHKMPQSLESKNSLIQHDTHLHCSK